MDRYELVDFLRDYIQNKLDYGKSNIIEEQVVIIVSTGYMADQFKTPMRKMLMEMLKDVDNDCLAIGRPDEFFFTGRRPKIVLVYGTNFTAEQMGRIFEFITMHERKDYCVRFFNR